MTANMLHKWHIVKTYAGTWNSNNLYHNKKCPSNCSLITQFPRYIIRCAKYSCVLHTAKFIYSLQSKQVNMLHHCRLNPSRNSVILCGWQKLPNTFWARCDFNSHQDMLTLTPLVFPNGLDVEMFQGVYEQIVRVQQGYFVNIKESDLISQFFKMLITNT